MTSTTTGRVSKGVFVFKGKKKAAKCRDYFNAEHAVGEKNDRLQLCLELVERNLEKFELMQSEMYTKLFEEVTRFISSAHSIPSPDNRSHGTFSQYSEIPTAALITGVNTPDHESILNNLVSLIHEKVTPHIAIVKSKDCPTLKNMMQTTISQIMDNHDVLSDEEEEEDGDKAKLSVRHLSYSMSILESWYLQTAKVKCQSPRKRKSDRSLGKTFTATSRMSPLVVVFEDFERFVPRVVQDYITICSKHLTTLPFVFVFDVATTVTAVHRLLPQHVSSLLCMEKFQAPPSSDCLDQLIEQVLMVPDFPFKLGGRVFHLLVDMFLYHDFSVLRFSQSFQFALLDHFWTNPVSIMTTQQTDLRLRASKLSVSELDHFRSLTSFRRFVETKPATEQIKLLENDQYTKKCLVEMLEAIYDYNSCVHPILSCLHCFVHKLPSLPLGHKIREIYGMLLNQNICESVEYREAISILRTLSKDEIINKLDLCIGLLEECTSTDLLSDVKDKLIELRNKFENIELLMQQEEGKEDLKKRTKQEERKSFSGKMDLVQLKQTLQELERSRKKTLTVYEVIRQETIDYLDSVFRCYLISPASLPLHEVMYYNKVSAVKTCINAVPRTNLENGLSNPYYYLQREDLRCDPMAIPAHFPDVCIAYKLHNECGRLINLYDWLQAFSLIVKPSSDQNEVKTRKPDQLVQARFIRAVSELQFLGFIKPTKKKTDHVARLTWGAC